MINCPKCNGELLYAEDLEVDIGGGDTKKGGECWNCSDCGSEYLYYGKDDSGSEIIKEYLSNKFEKEVEK